MKKLHDVYWGTHGCKRTRGHANRCICDCDTTIPVNHLYVFGDDESTAVRDVRFVLPDMQGVRQ